MNRLLRVSLALFLVFPIIVLLDKSKGLEWPQATELFHVFSFTIYQATLSAVVSLVLGTLGALGLVGRVKFRGLLEGLLLLPNLVPTILLIIATMSFVNRVGQFPFGLDGIVLLHSILNSGLVAVALARIMEVRLGPVSELAYVEGVSSWRFLFTAMAFLKKEFLMLFLFVFSICFTSFAIPLIVGGVAGTTVEVLIYNKIRTMGSWEQALSLSLLQMALVFILALIVSTYKVPPRSVVKPLRLLARPKWLGVPMTLTLVVAMGLIGPEVIRGLEKLTLASQLAPIVFENSLSTLWVGLVVGLAVVALLLVISFVTPHKIFQRFLLGYSVPSTAITGFAILLVTDDWPHFRIIVGVTLILLPVIYRLIAEEVFTPLENQIVVARTLGASEWSIFSQIKWPQIADRVFLAGGIAAFWAVGDFALSSIVAGSDVTLALTIKSLLASYRLDMAVTLVWLLMILGLMLFVSFRGVGHVFSRKSLS